MIDVAILMGIDGPNSLPTLIAPSTGPFGRCLGGEAKKLGMRQRSFQKLIVLRENLQDPLEKCMGKGRVSCRCSPTMKNGTFIYIEDL
jgi:hypothetical protein